MNHDEIRDSLEAYALGVLDDAERAEVVTHLASCDACRRELESFEQIAAALPAALAVAAPVPPSDVAAQRIQRAIRRRSRRSRVLFAAAAVAVVLFGLGVVWVWRSERTLADERQRSDRLIEEQSIVFEVVDSPDRERIVLRAGSDDANWYGKAFTSPDMPFVVVMANRLPEPRGGNQYHVWLTWPDGTTTLAGALEINEDGFATLVVTADSPGPIVDRVEVTEQPAGATAPGGDVILSSDND